MRLPGTQLLRDRAAVRAFERQNPAWRKLVFYSEGPGDWPHIGPIVEALLRHHDRPMSYLTSDPADPGLAIEDDRFRAFTIGSGTARTVLFARIQAGRFVMTLPDLGNLWLKRSVHPVEYVYVFHSTNSTHTSYRKGAFDNFDTILCVGPHHLDEIRATEDVYGLRQKTLVEHGSVKLDAVIGEAQRQSAVEKAGDEIEVLIAPTWGESSFMEWPIGWDILTALLGAGFRTTLRLHPMTVRRMPGLVSALERTYGAERRFALERDMSAMASWLRSDVMVSDWSGAATEYAFATERPVIYIDTPPKIMNPEWGMVGLPSFESEIRSSIGLVASADQIDGIPSAVADAAARTASIRDELAALRDRKIFNVGSSARVAAAFLGDQ